MKIILLLAVASLFLVACGGNSNDDGSNPTTLTGVFLDSAVINADYKTQTQSSTTNSQGEYQYLAGETVTFAIGDLEFPVVQADKVITPLNMAVTPTITTEAVVNMIRLLQTLDKDGNPANGIEITDTAKQAATSVSFSQSISTFATENNIINLVSSGGQDSPIGELITEGSAINHFQGTIDNFVPNEEGYFIDKEGTFNFVYKYTQEQGNKSSYTETKIGNLGTGSWYTFINDGINLYATSELEGGDGNVYKISKTDASKTLIADLENNFSDNLTYIGDYLYRIVNNHTDGSPNLGNDGATLWKIAKNGSSKSVLATFDTNSWYTLAPVGNYLYAYGNSAERLVKISITDGSVAIVGNTEIGNIDQLSYDGENLYGASYSNKIIYKISLDDAHATIHADYSSDKDTYYDFFEKIENPPFAIEN